MHAACKPKDSIEHSLPPVVQFIVTQQGEHAFCSVSAASGLSVKLQSSGLDYRWKGELCNLTLQPEAAENEQKACTTE